MKDNESGFPVYVGLRDWFAGKALQVFITEKVFEVFCNYKSAKVWDEKKMTEVECMIKGIKEAREEICFQSYRVADAMLAEREKKK